ncbi:MAG: hypothetical protein NC452_10315 [Eubacterium sp.]|nr:hypothetical protein [Eubacterium sp.]
MANANAVLDENLESNEDLEIPFDLDEFERVLESDLEEQLSDFELAEEEKEMIANPDNLGKVILNEVWNQFGNQIGLDMTNETTIQKYDREHPETYDEVGKAVLADERYIAAKDEMKERQISGNLKDEYTGKDIKANDSANLDHVVSRKEIYENPRRKQANLSTADLANKQENLKPTTESLNKSKKEKSVDEYIEKREQREADLKKENERKNKKIDESNKSDVDKRLEKEKNNKRLQNKLDADDELMKKADNEARKAINKDIAKGAVKEVGKKAGFDALKQMAISALFSLLKEVMNGFIRFLKSKAKSFKSFLDEMKNAMKSFFEKLVNVLQTGASSLIGTILSEIFGPIVSMFKKLASLIKQGVASVVDAVRYLSDKKNKDKPFSIKVAQVGKIITTGLVSGGAIFLGEFFEKILLGVPGMQFELPLIGTLANVIGLFLASLLSGLVGAIVINLIDKFIANRQKAEAAKAQVEKGNDVLNTQRKLIEVKEMQLQKTKASVENSIAERHQEANNIIREAANNILNSDADEDLDEIYALLNNM